MNMLQVKVTGYGWDRENTTLKMVKQKYKLLHLGTPQITEKQLCNFVSHRATSITHSSASSAPFPLHSGVSQGSVLSPTLFIIYTSDMPPPDNADCMDIFYADDATQIITSNGTLNDHDTLMASKEWKTKTNIEFLSRCPWWEEAARHTYTEKHCLPLETMPHVRSHRYLHQPDCKTYQRKNSKSKYICSHISPTVPAFH